MKRLTLFFLLGIFTTGLFAQKISSSQVPYLILKDFKSKFNNAKKVKWIKEEKNYEAEFKINGKAIDVTYDTIGNWVETLSEISLVDLPSNIVNAINKLFHDCKIISAARLDQNKNDALFEAEIRFKGKKSIATFDTNGNQID